MVTTTSGDGSYQFSNVAEGTYLLEETDPTGYTSVTANVVPVAINSGPDQTLGSATANFADQAPGNISGTVYNDLNGNQRQDYEELGIGGVTVQLVRTSDGTVIGTQVTSGDGAYIFVNVESGDYYIEETDPDGFVSTSSNIVVLRTLSTNSTTINFGDQPQGIISGTVFTDLSANGSQDVAELGLGGVLVSLNSSEGEAISNQRSVGNGTYLYNGLSTETYQVVETDPTGFVSTTENNVTQTVSLTQASTVNFGRSSRRSDFRGGVP